MPCAPHHVVREGASLPCGNPRQPGGLTLAARRARLSGLERRIGICDHGGMPRKKQDEGPRNPVVEARCELCGRDKPLTKHHLIPRAVHGKKRFLKRYDKQEMRRRGIMLCRLCHGGIHDLYSEKELAERFTTLAALLADERVQQHIKWARKRKR